MKLKRLLATFLVFALVVSLGGGTMFAANILTVNDLPTPGSWHYDALVSAIENDVMTAEGGLIRPDDLVTIEQMYRYAGNALGVTLTVPAGGSAVATRENMFVLLADITGAELSPLDSVDTLLKNFTDRGDIASAARSDIAALVKAGYITGVVQGGASALVPKRQLTRAEFAVLAHRLFGTYVNTAGTVTTNVGNITIRVPGVTLNNIRVNGDIIIGGSGGRTVDLSLINTTVTGRMIVRGNASVTVNNGSTVGTIHNYADLTYVGYATNLNVREGNKKVSYSGGYLRNLNVESNSNTLVVGNQAEITNFIVSGNGNDISGNGRLINASFSGNNNKLNVPNSTVVSNTGSGNVLSTKSGTFNMTAIEIVSNTTIQVTFDSKIESAPASAFTLSGDALRFASKATPDSTSISSSGLIVSLTYNGATFLSSTGATITATDGVVAVEKASMSVKTMSTQYYSSLVSWSNPSAGWTHSGYNPYNPGYNPYYPGYNPGYNTGYNPGYNPGYTYPQGYNVIYMTISASRSSYTLNCHVSNATYNTVTFNNPAASGYSTITPASFVNTTGTIYIDTNGIPRLNSAQGNTVSSYNGYITVSNIGLSQGANTYIFTVNFYRGNPGTTSGTTGSGVHDTYTFIITTTADWHTKTS